MSTESMRGFQGVRELTKEAIRQAPEFHITVAAAAEEGSVWEVFSGTRPEVYSLQ
jgi:hypothetical protein